MSFRTLFRSAAMMLLFSFSAAAADVWTEVRTDNFTVTGDAGEAEIRQAAEKLERFRRAIRSIFPMLKTSGRSRTNVIVFKSPQSYRSFKPKTRDGQPDDAVTGYFLAGEDVNYITFAVSGKADPYTTVYHEYIHHLLNSNFGTGIHAWLSEGLAEYLETLEIGAGGKGVIGRPPSEHLGLLRKNGPFSVSELISRGSADIHSGDTRSRQLFYAQAWALVHSIVHFGGREPLAALSRLIAAADPTKAAELVDDRDALERNLKAYIANGELPTALVPLGSNAPEPGLAAQRISEARAEAYLGDLQCRLGNCEEGEARLRNAVRLEPDSVFAKFSLAHALIRVADYPEARKLLESAVRSGSADHLAHFYYAYAISRENAGPGGRISEFAAADSRKMRESLQRSIEIDPEFAPAYALLAFVNLIDGTNYEGSAAMLKRSLELDPGSEENEILLARALLRMERLDEAKRIAERLAAQTTDRGIKADADEILLTIVQFTAARYAERRDLLFVGAPPPLILKRSAVTDADLERIDRDRVITNLNRVLGVPGKDERRAVGYIDAVTCSNGSVRFDVRSDGRKFSLASGDFSSITLSVLTEGSSTFAIDCGVSFPKQLTAVTFHPSKDRSGSRGRLISIAFVPDFFILKTPAEIARARTVVVEDDRLFGKSGEKKGPEQVPPQR